MAAILRRLLSRLPVIEVMEFTSTAVGSPFRGSCSGTARHHLRHTHPYSYSRLTYGRLGEERQRHARSIRQIGAPEQK